MLFEPDVLYKIHKLDMRGEAVCVHRSYHILLKPVVSTRDENDAYCA